MDSDSEEYAPIRGDTGEIDNMISTMRDFRGMLDTEKEFASISQAEKVVLAKEMERSAITGKLQDELDILTDRYEAAARAAERPAGALTAEAYEARVLDLEKDQYASGKAVNEEANGVAQREAELTRARGERDDVRKWDPTAGATDASKVLRLQLFAQLGFRALEGGKILVSNNSAPDIHVVAAADDRVATANKLWALAG
ncbi:hypothetical protein CC85DRAFT_312015 [Cutaneotrichosporon oleaginosum]|uniref:Kinetochore protein Spc24 n=1 Tax=Cutaneotrichosporon oleaginosum TaxID=879819 RepID=A0A0J0XPB0_9TREE|nr:uncharacterized protein CC85DRAFT_312015 [Cutaneotrichosporon oleaginosum]KLT42935.1 hypothetical protein CC85DRAFT_312015 [Cutaneotrichosporon oleaginosum]TXT12637.1 hypothetical protein COLE_03047 [Cutaneotrichosporon oleaginosum]